jgi:beta-hydroxylase
MAQMLAAVFAPKFLIVYAYIASALWVHFRGQVRHRFTRQLTDHSTFFAPINCFMYLFSKVPSTPYHDPRSFPELQALKDNWHILRDEALRLQEEGDIKGSDKLDDVGFNSFFRRGWKRYYLKWYGDPLPSAAAQCPKSVALVQTIPTLKAAMFTSLPPGGKLVAHRDPYAGSLRYHLGLITPNDDRCRIIVDGKSYSWRDGEDVVFDETFIHYAENFSDENRVILFCDVERPMRFRWALAVNRFFAKYLIQAGATRNADGDKVSGLNKAFAYIYPIRTYFKGIKKKNRKLYYAIKYAFFGGLLGAFLVLA